MSGFGLNRPRADSGLFVFATRPGEPSKHSLDVTLPEVTREIYLHSLPGDAKNVVEKMDELLIGPKRAQIVEIQNSGTTVFQ
jgi:hypothetical protein